MNDIDNLSIDQLSALILGVEYNVYISDLINPLYTALNLRNIIITRSKGANLDIKVVDSDESKKEKLYMNAYESGLDISDINNPNLSLEQLKLLIDYKYKDIDITCAANPLFSIDEMKFFIEALKDIEPPYDNYYVIRCLSDREVIDKLYDNLKAGKDILSIIKPISVYREDSIMKIKDYINNYQEKEEFGKSFPISKFMKVYTNNKYTFNQNKVNK